MIPREVGGGQSTALVLWLMILLVFAPIAAAHGLALLTDRGPKIGQVAR
jgi:hypothetical protein